MPIHLVHVTEEMHVCGCAARRIPSGQCVNDSRGYVRSHSGAEVDSLTGDQVNRV